MEKTEKAQEMTKEEAVKFLRFIRNIKKAARQSGVSNEQMIPFLKQIVKIIEEDESGQQ